MSMILVLATALVGGCQAHKVATLEDELQQRDATIEQMRTENQGYVMQLGELRQELGRVQNKNDELAKLYSSLVDEFEPQIQDGTASLVIFDDRSVLALGEQICFDSGSAKLTEAGKVAVHRLAEVLLDHPYRRFQVEGHTDKMPIATSQYPSNWELGSARAVTVVKELIADGIAPNRLSAATYADTAPLATNDRADGRALNRRMTVTLQTTLQETGAQQALYESAKKHGHLAYGDLTVIKEPVATTE